MKNIKINYILILIVLAVGLALGLWTGVDMWPSTTTLLQESQLCKAQNGVLNVYTDFVSDTNIVVKCQVPVQADKFDKTFSQ